jgi:hypothetical protein
MNKIKYLANSVFMIRPKHFSSNEQTLLSNSFQNTLPDDISHEQLSATVNQEFDAMVAKVEQYGVDVTVFDDLQDPLSPDAIFPNNWLTTHLDGKIITYPMMAATRRNERRKDIIEYLLRECGFTKHYAFDYLEAEGKYLEGTGSMVLDRANRIAYASLSPRTHIEALDKFAVLNAYRKIVFNAEHKAQAIYHTNVMMSLGLDFCIVCLDAIPDEVQRYTVRESLQLTGKEIIEISSSQMENFAGNALSLRNRENQPLLVISSKAVDCMSGHQLESLNSYATLVQIDIPSIEKYGGGSVRCMMAELYKSL